MEKERKTGIKELAQLFFIYSIRYLIPLFSPPIRANFARVIGYFSMRGEKFQSIKTELKKLFGSNLSDNEAEVIALRALNNYRKDFFDTWCFPSLHHKNIHKFGYLDGRENLDAALRKGKGAIVAVSHFGLWKALLPVLGYENYQVTQIGKNPLEFIDGKNSLAYNKIMEIEYQCEKALPSKFLYLGQLLRPVYKSLANNEIVVISFDGIKGTKRILSKLFNRGVYFSSGPVALSLATGAPLLPAFMIREKDERHRIRIEQELTFSNDIDKERVFQEAVDSYSKVLSPYVQKYPCHYAMFMYIAMVHYRKGDQQVFL